MSVAITGRDGRIEAKANGTVASVLCAIYVRKSTDENLQGDFTTLDNQAEYCRSFIKSREPMGWRPYSEVYSDAGFSGKNIDRPALGKLMADARAGKFKVVVCYKYDRLTRNTRDFLEILALFEERGIDFVSVTQPIDTTSPVGRLMRSILMEFAQFEREMIAERTRDKLSAMIKKGKWTGGPPPLGYDLDRQAKKLIINDREAPIVRAMFAAYLETGSLSIAAGRLNDRGLRMKAWSNKEGKPKGGGRFFKTNMSHLLRNPIYLAKRRYQGELYQAEHQPIIEEDTFQRAQVLLGQNRVKCNTDARDRHDFPLKGLVRCAACGSMMIPHFSRSGARTNLYYRCSAVNRTDRRACTVRAVRARALEQFVIEQIKVLAEDRGLLDGLVARSLEDAEELPGIQKEKIALASELGKVEADARGAMGGLSASEPGSAKWKLIMDHLDGLASRREELQARLAQVEERILEVESRSVDVDALRRNLAAFPQLFESLEPLQRKELIRLLVKEVIYDKPQSRVRLGLIPCQGFEWPIDRFSVTIDERTKWLRQKYLEGNKFYVEKTIRKCLDVLPDLEKTPLGGRLRFLRRRQRLTQVDLARRTGISAVTICKLERGGATLHPEIVGKLLAYFGREAAEAFPEGKDGVDHFVPVSDFGSWLRNFRVRKGLQQVELAKLLGVCKASLSAYEQNQTRPRDVVLKRLKKVFRLNGEFDRFL